MGTALPSPPSLIPTPNYHDSIRLGNPPFELLVSSFVYIANRVTRGKLMRLKNVHHNTVPTFTLLPDKFEFKRQFAVRLQPVVNAS
jgi:hypothetical protein